tara:strand:- start:156 stop:3131 length:2976 start_codon:yes stop_codon:yes gene_type:complete
MDTELLNWWAGLEKGHRLLILLRLGEHKHVGERGWDENTTFGPPGRMGYERGLCALIQHPKALCWLMRDTPNDDPYGETNLSNIRKQLKEKGLVEIHGKCETIIGKERRSITQSVTKIVFLSTDGREKANQLLRTAPSEPQCPPEWFLYAAVLGFSRPNYDGGKHHPLPVNLFDIRPKHNQSIYWSRIDEDKNERPSSPCAVISNYQPSDLIDLIRIHEGIHFLQGDAGSGKTQLLNRAYSLWDPPHPCSLESNTFPLKFTVFQFISQLKGDEDSSSISNIEDWLKHFNETILQLMLNQFGEGIDRSLIQKMLELEKPRIILFLDALDEINRNMRFPFMTMINQWTLETSDRSVLISTRPLVTSIRHPSNLQTVVELKEISVNWPNENESLDHWPREMRRTPLTWNIVNASKKRISDEDDEEEILDRYIDQSFEGALNRSGDRPPRKKSEIINYLERIALIHNEHRETTILTIPELQENETKEELEKLHQNILPWVNTHMQILRETSTWKYANLGEGALLSYEFVHRRIQEFLASRALAKLSDLSWLNLTYVQDPEWGWPVIRDVARRNGKELIIQRINELEEDILGHVEGLRRYLDDPTAPLHPASWPPPPSPFDTETGEHVEDLSFHSLLLQMRKRDSELFGDEGWNLGDSVFGSEQAHSDEVEDRVDQILKHAFDANSEIDWVKEFGWPVDICLPLVNSYLDLFPKNIEILENAEKVTLFADYLIRLFWQAIKPDLEPDGDAWDQYLQEHRTADMAKRLEMIKDGGIHIVKNHTQPPFKHPAPSLVKWWTEIGIILPAIDLTWMFNLPLEPDLYDVWLEELDRFSPKERLNELGWTTHLLPFLVGSKSQPGASTHRLPLPRLPMLGQSSHQKFGQLLDLLDEHQGLNRSVDRNPSLFALVDGITLDELLHYSEKSNKIGLIKKHMQSRPFCPEPVKRGELFQEDRTCNPATRYHVEDNWFRNAWCHSRFEPGNLPLLVDYPWFEELWG